MPISQPLEAFAFMAGLIIRLAVAGIFLHSALHALRDPFTHIGIVQQYRLLPAWITPVVAMGIPVAMLVNAVALLIPASAPAAAWAAAFLLALFSVAIAVNLARGRESIDCGCGGAPGQRLSAGLVVRNGILLMLLVCAATAPVYGEVDVAVLIGVIGGAATTIGFYFAANVMLHNRSVFGAMGVGR